MNKNVSELPVFLHAGRYCDSEAVKPHSHHGLELILFENRLTDFKWRFILRVLHIYMDRVVGNVVGKFITPASRKSLLETSGLTDYLVIANAMGL
tara:strand:+ start:107 stop:391 length:285 start_codon:yes stop_codon:yes gene_type:complete